MAGIYTLNTARYSNTVSYTKASTSQSIWCHDFTHWFIGPTSAIGGDTYSAYSIISRFDEPYFPQSGWNNFCGGTEHEVSTAQCVREYGNACENCPAGQSSSAGGVCADCPTGESSSAGGVCGICLAGQFSVPEGSITRTCRGDSKCVCTPGITSEASGVITDGSGLEEYQNNMNCD